MYNGNDEAFDNSYVQNVHWTIFFAIPSNPCITESLLELPMRQKVAVSSVTQGKKKKKIQGTKNSPDGKIHTASILYVLVTPTLAEESYSASVGVTKNLNLFRW